MLRSWQTLLQFIVCLAGTGLPAATSPAQTVYYHYLEGTPKSLDPLRESTIYGAALIRSVYDTLYEYRYLKRPHELKPLLAEKMPEVFDGGKRLVVRLRRGVFFADDACFPAGIGRELTAEDVVYTFKRHFDHRHTSAGRWLWIGLFRGLQQWADGGSDYKNPAQGIRALDRYTVEFCLTEPTFHFPHTLATHFAAIVPHEAVERYGDEIGLHPVGSGPWILKSIDHQKALLTKNPKYRQEIFDIYAEGYEDKLHGFTGIKALHGRAMPLVDQVKISFLRDRTASWLSFEKGDEIQMDWVPPACSERVFASRKPLVIRPEYAQRYHSAVGEGLETVYLEFNLANPRIGYSEDHHENERNRALRCALRKSFDWSKRIDRSFHGIGEPFAGVIPPMLGSYADAKDSSTVFDPKGARALLKKYGWNAKNLPTLVYSDESRIEQKRDFEIFRSNLVKAGYPSKKVLFNGYAAFADFWQAKTEGKLMIANTNWIFDIPDPENVMQLFYSKNDNKNGCLSNTSHYKNPEYDVLYEAARKLPLGGKRDEIFERMNQMLINDCAVIAGYSRPRVYMWHKNVVMYPLQDLSSSYFKYIGIDTIALAGSGRSN